MQIILQFFTSGKDKPRSRPSSSIASNFILMNLEMFMIFSRSMGVSPIDLSSLSKIPAPGGLLRSKNAWANRNCVHKMCTTRSMQDFMKILGVLINIETNDLRGCKKNLQVSRNCILLQPSLIW